jgi:carboxymethylenebutenolidase
VLGIFASSDKWINETMIDGFRKAMKKAGKSLEDKIFEADHAFANPSNPNHDAQAAKEAWDMTVSFFGKHLK